jgi:hypothetical protein
MVSKLRLIRDILNRRKFFEATSTLGSHLLLHPSTLSHQRVL